MWVGWGGGVGGEAKTTTETVVCVWGGGGGGKEKKKKRRKKKERLSHKYSLLMRNKPNIIYNTSLVGTQLLSVRP